MYAAKEHATYVGHDNGHSIQTRVGIFMDLVAPQPYMVHLKDIAEAAAKINRFTGHTTVPYSVAQHCVYVSHLVSAPAAPYALLHDAHESYINDKSTPQKEAEAIILARELGVDIARVKEAVRVMARQLDTAIFARMGLKWPAPPELWAEVKQADVLALATERRDFLEHLRGWAFPMPLPRKYVIHPWPWVKAADEYMTRARELGLPED